MLQKIKKDINGDIVGGDANHPQYDTQIRAIITRIYNRNANNMAGAFTELKAFTNLASN